MNWQNIVKGKRISDAIKNRIDDIMSDGNTRNTNQITDALLRGKLKYRLPSKILIARYLNTENKYIVLLGRTGVSNDFKLR